MPLKICTPMKSAKERNLARLIPNKLRDIKAAILFPIASLHHTMRRALRRRPQLADFERYLNLILSGVVPMTRRIDILKIIAVAVVIGVVFYYLAHRGG